MVTECVHVSIGMMGAEEVRSSSVRKNSFYTSMKALTGHTPGLTMESFLEQCKVRRQKKRSVFSNVNQSQVQVVPSRNEALGMTLGLGIIFKKDRRLFAGNTGNRWGTL